MGHRPWIMAMTLALLVNARAEAQAEPDPQITDWPPATLEDFYRATWAVYGLVCGPIVDGGGPGRSAEDEDCDDYWIVLEDILGSQTVLWQRQQASGLTGTVPPFPELEDRVVRTILVHMDETEPDWNIERDEGLEDTPMPTLEQLAGLHAAIFTQLTGRMVNRALSANPDIFLPD